MKNVNRKLVVYLVLLVAAIGAIYIWSSKRDYTDKKGEEAVKIISDNPDAIFKPDGIPTDGAEKKE